MSTLYGVQATKLAATPLQLAEQGYQKGKVHCLRDKYTLLADLAQNDVINMGGKLPQGARIIMAVMRAGALGGSCTLDLGWAAGLAADGVTVGEAASAAAIFSALPATTAANTVSVGSSYEGTAFIDKVMAADVQLKVTAHAASSGATAQTVAVDVFYTVD
jgi:hypothetical protein